MVPLCGSQTKMFRDRAVVLSKWVVAGKPFPRIAPGATVSCAQAKAKVSVVIAWKKANRNGVHRGHAVLLLKGERSGDVRARKLSSRRLRSARTQKIRYRFRFGKRDSKRLCNGKAELVAVASHGHDKDGQGLFEIYRVARRTLGAKASASDDVGAAGPFVPGSDCKGGGTNAIIMELAELENCDLVGAQLPKADFSFASLSTADLFKANVSDANLSFTNLNGTNFSLADLTGANLNMAHLGDTFFDGADLTGADLTGAQLLNTAFLDGANCSDTTKPDGSKYPTGTGNPPFVPC